MNEENCEFCRGEFKHTVIKDYENWEIQLFLNQYYLGRCIIKLERHAVDITELSKNERDALFEEVVPELKSTLDELFEPDLYNYATLGNDCRHFHLHVIPRYSSVRKFNGREFTDEKWNTHYKPYPKDFEVEEEMFKKLKEEIIEEMQQ